MSLQNKLRNAAAAAATEAVQIERARCLWLLDCMMEAANAAPRGQPEALRHFMNTKLQIVMAIVSQAKRGIISGLQPPTPFSVLRQPVNDVGQMQTRISKLIDLLEHLGYGENVTIDDVETQIVKWEAQEDKIDELEAKIEELESEKKQANTLD